MKPNKDAVTLIELLVSIVMLSLIGLAFVSIENFSRKQLSSSDSRSKLLNQASIVVSAVSKAMQTGEGIRDFPVFYINPDNDDIRIRKTDIDPYVILPDDPVKNFVRICLNKDSHKMYYYPQAGDDFNLPCGDGGQQLAHNITSFRVTPLIEDNLYPFYNCYAVNISVEAELIGAREENTDLTKPKVKVETTLSCPSSSLS